MAKKPEPMSFLGNVNVAHLMVKHEGDTLYVKKPVFSWLPFFKKWTHLMSGITREELDSHSEEKVLFDPVNGQLNKKRIKIVKIDPATGELNYSLISWQDKAKVASLIRERDYYRAEAKGYEQYLKGTLTPDQFRENFKRDYEFYDGLKPTPLFNTTNRFGGQKK